MALVLAATASTGAGPADAPPTPSARPRSGIVERVEVREVQVFVTAWPKDGDAARCATLTREDFALDVDGVPTPILSLLPYDETAVEVPVGPSPATPPAEPAPGRSSPLSLVILIDEFHHSCQACAARMSCCEQSLVSGGTPLLRHDAYETARRMLRESFRPGVRVLVTSGPRLAPPPRCRWVVVEPAAPLAPGRWRCADGAPAIEVVDSAF